MYENKKIGGISSPGSKSVVASTEQLCRLNVGAADVGLQLFQHQWHWISSSVTSDIKEKTMENQRRIFKVDELELVSLLREGRGVLEGEVDVDWDPDRFAMKETPEQRLSIEKR